MLKYFIVKQNLYLLNNYLDDTSKIKTYVGEDGQIHFTDVTGADSVLPFSKGTETYIYKLGTGTSYNIKALFPDYYASLTNSNFITCITSVGAATTSYIDYNTEGLTASNYDDYFFRGNVTASSVSRSYNASTGKLTITKTSGVVSQQRRYGASNPWTNRQTATQSVSIVTYMVIGSILTP